MIANTEIVPGIPRPPNSGWSRARHTAASLWALAMLLCFSSQPAWGQPTREIRMPETPALSPDGSWLTFAWAGELWLCNIDGSDLQRLTNHRGRESQPMFSPDGSRIAFVSDRTGTSQVFLMNTDGSGVEQVTFHSAGYSLEDWFPSGDALLVTGRRDHFHRDAERLIRIEVDERHAERVLANVYAEDAKVSPDGTRILFTREGERWWRKGYQGERSAQVWMLDLESSETKELLHEGVECMWPIWTGDGKGFYFTKGTLDGFDLWRYRFPKNAKKSAKQQKVVSFDDDSIVFPTISRDGETVVFRHLFDLYHWKPGDKKRPKKIQLQLDADMEMPADQLRREFSRANHVAFSPDGLEIALIAGGDVWVMDTKLREPRQVTHSPGYEDEVHFSPDGQELWYTSMTDGQIDIWKATRKDTDQYWWQNTDFETQQVTEDAHVESDLRFTPDAQEMVFQQGRGDLAVLDIESGEKRQLISGFSGIDFDISSNGQWVTYAQQDNDFNSEIWITALDGSASPVNVSRHPDNEYGPKFSPDGRILAFTGRRVDEEVDIYYVYLQEADEDESSRQRLLEEAVEWMQKKRKEPAESKTESKDKKSAGDSDKDDEDKDGDDEDSSEQDDEGPEPFPIDFEDIHERLRRVSIPNSFEGGLLFSPDSKRLAFSASIDGKRGWYTIEFPDKLTPKLVTTTTGSNAIWSKEANGILFSRSGVPAKLDPGGGKVESYDFEVAHSMDRGDWLQTGFDAAWLVMREAWYDERFANHNWDAVRRKYSPVAAQMHDTFGLAEVVQLMLGELNGSHLGFYPAGQQARAEVEGWQDTTAHLGVRYDTEHKGPGLLVQDVILDGPADQAPNKLAAGDIILSIDGTAVDPDMDLTQVLNGRLDRDIVLKIRRSAADQEGDHEEDQEAQPEHEEIAVTVRPISYARARLLLYPQWLEHNRQLVAEASDGKLGYLHIRAMDMSSFLEFERQLYNVGYGREGLVIDVRDNGGGFTTDRLLTALTQPRHAITIPRGGGQGYPHDRSIFATWSKPIIVLCNQNSYSNAEIFSHAIKTLGRGQVVGVQTAGGVVSTGSASVIDVGRIRVPFRGWFLLNDGEDMERNGCLPNSVLWPKPGELPAGEDRQLDRAVELLLEEIGDGAEPKPLTYAAERDTSE